MRKIKSKKRQKKIIYCKWFKKYYYVLDTLFTIVTVKEINSKATNVLNIDNIIYLSKQESFVLQHCLRLSEFYNDINSTDTLINAVYSATRIHRLKLKRYYKKYKVKHSFHELQHNFICFIMFCYFENPDEKAFKIKK